MDLCANSPSHLTGCPAELNSGTGFATATAETLARAGVIGRSRGKHAAAVVDEIVEPLRDRDQRQRLRPAFLVIGGLRQPRAKHRVDFVLDPPLSPIVIKIVQSAPASPAGV